MKAVVRYIWGVLGAIGMLALCIVGASSWYKRRQKERGLKDQAADLARDHVAEVEARTKVELERDKAEAAGEMRDEVDRINQEVDNAAGISSFSDYLRSRIRRDK